MDKQTETLDIADLAQLSRAVQRATDDGKPFVVLPHEHKIENVERFAVEPTRIRGNTIADDLDSFVRYVLAVNTGDIYWRESETTASFTAVFNTDSWRDHRAIYVPQPSPEWVRWTGNNGKSKTQAEFALFMEDNAVDVVSPSAADMLEIAHTLEAKKKVDFASGIRLSNGQIDLTYSEQIQGTAAKGKLQIPELFKIGIPVFVGGDRYGMDARLRYRISDGQLSMWYNLVRPHIVIQDAVQTMVAAIQEKIALPIYRGAVDIIS
jgi:uncharacterized protein YfdQ (DUF2303 family)